MTVPVRFPEVTTILLIGDLFIGVSSLIAVLFSLLLDTVTSFSFVVFISAFLSHFSCGTFFSVVIETVLFVSRSMFTALFLFLSTGNTSFSIISSTSFSLSSFSLLELDTDRVSPDMSLSSFSFVSSSLVSLSSSVVVLLSTTCSFSSSCFFLYFSNTAASLFSPLVRLRSSFSANSLSFIAGSSSEFSRCNEKVSQ